MKSLFIMGMTRGGTTVAQDLFWGIPGTTIMDEVPIDIMAEAIKEGKTVVWKSPHDCLKGVELKKKFPQAVQVYVIRDGRANLAAHKKYLEVYGIDPAVVPYQGPKKFADLWNKFAAQALHSDDYLFFLEDLSTSRGRGIIAIIYDLCGYPNQEEAIEFWEKHIFRRSNEYPRKAVDLHAPSWCECLTEQEISGIDRDLLEKFGYE